MEFDFSVIHDAAKVNPSLMGWVSDCGVYNTKQIDGTCFLFHHCLEGLHRIDDDGFGGYTVMSDNTDEVKRHFQAVRLSHGQVLKTGLGMGCFIRMCLLNDDIEHIDVIEVVPSIVRHFGAEFKDNPRVTIHTADAFEFDLSGKRWDFAWHDIYCDGNNGLDVLHIKLMQRFSDHVVKQAAWGLPRPIKRIAKIAA